ncbi:hypothetical protein [Spongiactinospora sp. TRM90649]|uniref:hypothetical protein n=1 Tax=Spongiactinospora sp. TRM90649 TaxID=3031114 RepID=UPI0023F84015|nr:hypothetical protein [Spongiactinospora sp. TRM90649]MDF5754255.1 hypothetical protein [Spongiactinospora sp. TRM90649]
MALVTVRLAAPAILDAALAVLGLGPGDIDGVFADPRIEPYANGSPGEAVS